MREKTSDSLVSRILLRSASLFQEDFAANENRLAEAIGGARILVVGASGSIGSAFVKQILRFLPSRLHAVDINENTLVEMVRDLRSSDLRLPPDFATFCVNFGAEEFRHLLMAEAPYDYFINFSAMKHVRSERDAFSLMRMIRTNACYLRDFLATADRWQLKKVFSVSTDKAVRPVSLMGATKNLMEKILFAHSDRVNVSTARFANVAFSEGSLLCSFERRLRQGQPLAGPDDVKRYFLSHEEAGQLCLFACFLGENREVFFPHLDATKNLLTFPHLAAIVLDHHGLEPLPCRSAEEAKRMVGRIPGKWPCYFAPSDTSGEKPVEEFHRADDLVDTDTYRSIGIVREPPVESHAIEECLSRIDCIRASESWSKEDIVEALSIVVPDLGHVVKTRSLDQKM